jgi:hypothetical protein
VRCVRLRVSSVFVPFLYTCNPIEVCHGPDGNENSRKKRRALTVGQQ